MRLFDDFFDISPRIFPPLSSLTYPFSSFPLNVSSTSTHYIVRAELSGVSQNQISVDINEDGLLTIQAELQSKDISKDEESENVILQECYIRDKLQRSIKFVKDNIDIDGVKAELNNGELIVKIPKKTQEKNKKKIIKIVKGKL